MREWWVQTRRGASELWHGIGRWVCLFSLVGFCCDILVCIIVLQDYPPVWTYVAVVLASVFVAWVWFFRKRSIPRELEEGDA